MKTLFVLWSLFAFTYAQAGEIAPSPTNWHILNLKNDTCDDGAAYSVHGPDELHNYLQSHGFRDELEIMREPGGAPIVIIITWAGLDGTKQQSFWWYPNEATCQAALHELEKKGRVTGAAKGQ